MPDHAALIATICDRPQDDGPRLVYSDWLEDEGEADRAEFIRVQIELAKRRAGPAGDVSEESPWLVNDREYQSLRRRERELLEANWPAWTGSWNGRWFCDNLWIAKPTPDPYVLFRRGFIDSISCTWPDWLQHAAAIREAQPVTKVRLTTKPRWIIRADYAELYTDRENVAYRCKCKPPPGALTIPSDDYLLLLLAAEWPGLTFELPPARHGSTLFQTSFNDVQISWIWDGQYVDAINIVNGRPDAVRVSDIIIGPQAVFQYSDRLTGTMSRMIPRGVLTVESLSGEVILRLTLPEYMRQHAGMPMNAGEPTVENLDVTPYLDGGMRRTIPVAAQYATAADLRQYLGLDEPMSEDVLQEAIRWASSTLPQVELGQIQDAHRLTIERAAERIRRRRGDETYQRLVNNYFRDRIIQSLGVPASIYHGDRPIA